MTAAERALEVRRERARRLTSVGAGTPMGAYMRCFWHPVAASVELDAWPTKKVRLLGEDLALFRGDDGTLGLVRDRCPHRGAALSCGMTDGKEIRCAYHGWAFDTTGQCTDTPAEPPGSKLKERIKIDGYPVRELGGMVFAYLGKLPAPLLPNFEHLVREGLDRHVNITHFPCNWLQIAENNLDAHHLAFLHMRYVNWLRKRKGEPPIVERKQAKMDFEVFEFGILKRRLWEGDAEENNDEWNVGHPMLFPGNQFLSMTPTWVEHQFRVPLDDEHTIVYWYNAKAPDPGETASQTVPLIDNPWQTPTGEYIRDSINGQDAMVTISQGPVTDHALENLGESDRGVALYRKTLLEQLERVERGEDPLGVVRDPAKNEPYITLPMERRWTYGLAGVQNSAVHEFPERELEPVPASH
jgi:5,5'-dehydrodivanillate O-demethylase